MATTIPTVDETITPYTVTPVLNSATFPEDIDTYNSEQPSRIDEKNTVNSQINTMVTAMNIAGQETEDNALDAERSAYEATGVANNNGAWSNLTGALNIPASANHTGSTWVLNVNLADVTASEPTSVNTDWTEISGVTQGELDLKADIVNVDKYAKLKVPITPDADTDYTLTEDENLYGYLKLADGNWLSSHSIIVDITTRAITVDNTDGTYDAPVKTPAGTAQTVKAGEIETVYIDGTDVIEDKRQTSKVYVDAQAHKLNGIINGGFDFWDYYISQTSSGYGSDNRWRNDNGGTTKTHTQQTSGDTERTVFNSKYYSRTVVSTVAGVGNYCLKAQRIEGVNSYAGGKAVISFKARADASKNIALEFAQDFGTGGSPSARVDGIGSQLIALTTTWQYFKITVDISSIVGKTLGTDDNDRLDANFWLDAGIDYDARTASLGQQSGTFDIAEVRLDDGEVARPFGVTDMASERSRCNRFLPYVNTGKLSTPHGYGNAISTTQARIEIPAKTIPRISPTSVSYGGNLALLGVGGTIVVTSLSISESNHSTERNIVIDVNVASGLTAHATYLLRNNNDTTATIEIETEL